MVKRRLAAGRLYRVQPEVYSLTPQPSARGRMLAAALTFGAEAALSHRAAAAIWDLGPWPTGLVDVTVPGNLAQRPGTRRHIADVERVVKDGFPVTTVARTLVDLAGVLPLGRLRDALERAEQLRLLDAKGVSEEMRGRRGARKIRALLREWTEPEPTRSELEREFRKLCEDFGIALPGENVVVLGYEVDLLGAKPCGRAGRLGHTQDAPRLRGGPPQGRRARGRGVSGRAFQLAAGEARAGNRRRGDQIGMSQSGRSRPSSCSSGSSSDICAFSLNSRSESRCCFPVGTNG